MNCFMRNLNSRRKMTLMHVYESIKSTENHEHHHDICPIPRFLGNSCHWRLRRYMFNLSFVHFQVLFHYFIAEKMQTNIRHILKRCRNISHIRAIPLDIQRITVCVCATKHENDDNIRNSFLFP